MTRVVAALGGLLAIISLVACGSGSGGGSGESAGLESANFGCDGACPRHRLEAVDVESIVARGVSAARGLGVSATISVVDRVGNVLATYQMVGALSETTIDGQIGATGGLEGIRVPSTFASISKAGTGAYLSSQGNAFSTRTASQIIQENFNPKEQNQPGGPLFGVQFSQLLCSDVTVKNPSVGGGVSFGTNELSVGLVGPRPLPLGLSADPGGLPLYKNGDVVGGVGVELDGEYRLDRDVTDKDDDLEERIALAASVGFEMPSERTGDRIFVAGKSLRTSDLSYAQLDAVDVVPLDETMGAYVPVPLFSDGNVRVGAQYGTAESGVLFTERVGVLATILVKENGTPRYPSRSGSPLEGDAELSREEVDALLDSVLYTAYRTRAAIRQPLDSQAHVSIWIVDTEGVPLGMVRTSDAPIFGIDVALQKGRTATFFSSKTAGAALSAVREGNAVGAFNDYVGAVRGFIGSAALTGTHAFTDRAGGNMSRPFFPDGINGNGNGPFSLPFPGTPEAPRTWSPFNTGLQLDLIFQRLVQPLGVPVNPPTTVPDSCTDTRVLGSRLRNGIQIFPGSVPLYRGTTLIGGIGISGDGIDQDDLIAFYGGSREGLDAVGHFGVGDDRYGFNAPKEIRADLVETPVGTTRLRYVNCPESPFRESSEQKVCSGL